MADIMNWIKFTTLFAAVWRFALPFCLLFAASFVGADVISIDEFNLDDYLNEDGLLVIKDGEFTISDPDDPSLFELVGIIIEKESLLTLEPLTMIHVSGGYVEVKGTLIVPSILGTGIYNSAEVWDGNGACQPDKATYLHVNGGTVKIERGDPGEFVADTVHVVVYAGGGTIDVESGVIFESGKIMESAKGDITKTGGGTWKVGGVTMTGAFNVSEGTVVLLNKASVGVLNLEAGTTLIGSSDDDGKKFGLTVLKGGSIEGTLENIGYLVVGGDTLTFEGGSHTIEKLGIDRGATLDLKDGTSIQLTAGDASKNYDDIIVEGKLKVSSTFGTGIYKGDLDTLELEPTYMTIAGGTVEIYKGDDPTLMADTIHTRVIGSGQIVIERDVTFQSGKIVWLASSDPNDTGADVYVSGGGTFQVDEVSLGDGYFIVGKISAGIFEGDGTTMEFLNTVTAGALYNAENTKVIAHGDAKFGIVNIAGLYDGNNSNLTIQYGGQITGNITGIHELTLGGGTLFLGIDNTATPTISVEKWTFSQPEETRIRIIGLDRGIHHYQKIIQITDEDNIADVLAVLRNSTTALYRPKWSQDGTYLDLELSVLSIDGYIRDEWKQRGTNIGNVGNLLEDISIRYPAFRTRLEGLNEAELQSVIRSTMAGELAGNTMRVAMQQPANTVFRHLDGVAPLRSPFAGITRGQVREGFNVWFNPFGQAEHAKGTADTFDGYDLSRYGFHVGGDIEIYKRAVAGILFGYTSPYVKSDLGKISADDFTAGVYLRTPLAWETMINMIVGFGSQDYQYKNTFGNSKFGGSAVFGSIELTRPVVKISTATQDMQSGEFKNNWTRTPLTGLIAVDFQSASMNSFIVHDPVLGGVLVEPDDLDSTLLRVGLLGEVWRLRARLQYMRQIAGNDFAVSSTSVVGDELSAATPVRSTQWGKDWLNIGIGGELLSTQHWRLFADYNFDMGKQTTSHLGSLNTIFRW